MRSPYNYDRKASTLKTALSCPEPTMAQQQFKDDSNPNAIMKLYARTGDASLLSVTNPQYGDFTGIGSYQEALNRVLRAEEAFASLPSGIRSRFHNNPAELIDFVADDKNYDEALKLGLLKPELSTPARPQEAGAGVVNSGDAPTLPKKPNPSKKGVSVASDASSSAKGEDA